MKTFISLCIYTMIWIILWWSINNEPYQENYTQNISDTDSQERKEIFFYWEASIEISPKKEDWLIGRINTAQKEIRLATYMFTLPSLRDALLRAKNRWVDIQIILEWNPYNAENINNETRIFLQKNNLSFIETTGKKFAFMHAKYMIIDDWWIISTANWTRSSFSKNREFFVIGNEPNIRKELRNIFDTDFWWKISKNENIYILWWPDKMARDKILSFMQSAKKDIKIYMPSITDKKIIDTFDKICTNWKMIQILLDQESELLKNKECPETRIMQKNSLHAKVVIVDDKQAFVSSFNFTENSLENNREVGVFIDKKSIYDIVNVFYADWEKSIDFRR